MTWKPHVTVAAIVEEQDKFLLVEEIIDGHAVYNQPAGHLEPGENLLQAVIRETREETAWVFEPEFLVGIYQWQSVSTGKSFLRFCIAGRGLEHDPGQALDTDIEGTVWLNYAAIQDNKQRLRSPLVLRGINDYLKGQHYSLDVLKGYS